MADSSYKSLLVLLVALLGMECYKPLQQVEHDAIVAALHASRGKVSGPGGAAQLLGLKPSTLESRMKKLGIERLGASS